MLSVAPPLSSLHNVRPLIVPQHVPRSFTDWAALLAAALGHPETEAPLAHPPLQQPVQRVLQSQAVLASPVALAPPPAACDAHQPSA